MSNVGENIKKRRKALGMSAEDLAFEVRCAPATIYRYESGAIEKMGTDKLIPIAKALKTTVADLLGTEDTPAFDYEAQGVALRTQAKSEKDWAQMLQELEERESRTLGVFVTPQEEQLINAYRDLTPDLRKKLMDIINVLKG